MPEKQDYINKMLNEVNNFLKIHQQDSSYCLNRCRVTKNKSDKLRYSFICWFLIKDPKFLEMTIEIACNVITSSLEKKSEANKEYILSCDLLSYSYTLFALYLPKDSQIRRIIKDTASEIITDAKQKNHVRWLIEPSEIIYNLLDAKEHDFASHLITNLHQGAYSLSILEDIPIDNRIGNCHIERDLLHRSIQFIKFLNLTESESDECRRRFHAKMAKSYEREAMIRELKGEDALLLATLCYLPAAREYGLAVGLSRLIVTSLASPYSRESLSMVSSLNS